MKQSLAYVKCGSMPSRCYHQADMLAARLTVNLQRLGFLAFIIYLKCNLFRMPRGGKIAESRALLYRFFTMRHVASE